MEYGSDPNHKNFYICPRVWCPYCEIPINYDSIKNSLRRIKRKHGLCLMAKCPFGNHDIFVETDGNNIYPGFVKNKHPDGYCLPCCKKVDMRDPKYSGHKLMKQCLGDDNVNNNDIEYSKYILDSNKVPLEKNRYGAIPRNVQKLFKNIYNHGHIEIGKQYFVRTGIKLNQNQSFLECIAKVMSDISERELKLADLKRFLISKLDDEKLFKSLNNGNLELIFKNDSDKPGDKYNWEELKEKIMKDGVRNSLLVALMPTASTSQILGNNDCFEPYTNNIYNRRTLAGDFRIINKHLVLDLELLNLWNDEMKDLIIHHNGSIQNIEIIPIEIRNLYKTAWEIEQKKLIQLSIDRGPYVDQTQSMNLFFEDPTPNDLTKALFFGWKNGLKTCSYYMRTQSKAEAQKFTIDPNKIKQIEKKYGSVCEGCSG